MRRLLVAITAWTLVLCAAATAAKLPVYRDPPSFKGRKSVPAYTVVEPPAPPAVKLSDTGTFPHEVIDDAGTAHIVWAEGRGDQDDAVYYCRLKRGATACDSTAVLVWNKTYGAGDGPSYNIDNTGPRIVQVGNELVVLDKRYPTGSERPNGTAGSSNTLVWTSSDGGTTWSDARLVGTLDMGQLAVVGSDTDAAIVNTANDPLCASGPAAWCIEVYRGGQFGVQGNLATRGNDSYYAGIAVDDTGHLIGVTENLDGTTEIRRWSGLGDMTDPTQWSTSSAPLDQPTIAGGPAGVFMLDYAQRYSEKFEVRRLNVGGDGVVTPGNGTSISEDGFSNLGSIGEDPAGGLHVAWSNDSQDANGGVFLRNSKDGGANFDQPLKLNDGHTNGQFDVQAAADGGGFALYNHTGGILSPGEIYASAFGTQAPTGKPGLGDLAGGEGVANVTCSTVGFGKFQIEATTGCLYRGQGSASNLVVSTGPLTLDGLQIIPDPGTKIVIDPKKLTIETFGAVHVLASNGQTSVELWHGTIKRDLSKAVPGSNLFEFPSNEFKANVLGFDIAADTVVKLGADGVHIPVDLSLPPAFGGFTGHAELVSNDAGLRLDSLHIHIGPVPLGALTIDNVDIAYSAGDDRWTGDGQLTVPAGGSVDAHFVFAKGDFVSASFGYTPNPPITIGPFVYLLNVNGGFSVKPIQISAGARVGAGAAINGVAPVSADGKFTMTFPTSGPADFKLTGNVDVFMFGIGNGFLDFQSDGYAAFGGHTGLDLGPLQVDANMDGFVDAPSGSFGADINGKAGFCLVFDLPIKGDTRICGSASSEAAISNAGFAICARIDPPDPFGGVSGGVEYPWSDFNPAILVNPALLTASLIDHIAIPCHADSYHSPPPRPVGARVAASGQIVSVKSGLPSETIQVDGDGGAPDVTVSGPGGASFTSRQPSKAGYVVKVEGIPAAYVVLSKPRAGDWTVTSNEGSPNITAVKVADGYTPAVVTAKVRRGRIAYRVAHSGHGQRVQFVEKGKFGTHVLGAVTGSHGTLRFKPAEGAGGKRTVVALVQHSAITTGQSIVGSFTQPNPPKPGAVGRLKAKHRTTTLSITWKSAKNAVRYAVLVKGSKGSKVGRLVAAKTKALTLGGMRRDEHFTVTVKALAKSGRAGPAKTAKA